MKFNDICLALFVILIWGTNFSFIKIGLEEFPPILFCALRFAVVAIPAVFFVPFPKASIWCVVGVGVFLGVLKFSLLFLAMRSDASAGLSSLILQAQVFLTIGLSVFIFKESVSRIQVFGIVISVLGFSFFVMDRGGNITLLGLGLILLAALFWAVSNLIMKKMGDANLLHFMVWVSVIPPLPLLCLSFVTESSDPVGFVLAASGRAWAVLGFVSYMATLVAFAIWGKLLKSYSAAVITPFALLIPVVGIFTSNILLNEHVGFYEGIGGGLIMFGLVLCALGRQLRELLVRVCPAIGL